MADAALKIDEHYSRIRGVTRPDLMDKAPYLCKRLKEKYPHVQDRELYSWLQSCCGNNEYFFVRSDRAFLLAVRTREFLDQRPTVREIFDIAELNTDKTVKGSDAEAYQNEQNAIALIEAAALYDALLRWCQSVGAGELIIDKFTDVPLGDKGREDPGTLRQIFAKAGVKLYRGEEIFALLDPNAKVRKLGA